MSECLLCANISTSHVAVVLLSSHIVVLFWVWLGLGMLNLRPHVSTFSMEILSHIRLHLEDKLTIFNESLRSAEDGRVGVKSGVVTLVPAACVESVEVIAPVEVETLCLCVVNVSLNIVVFDLPRHVLGIKSLSPRLESWGPEVHHDALRLVGQFDRGIGLLDATNLLVINRPGNELRSPCHFIDVPVVLGVEAGFVVVGFTLSLTITEDDIH